MAWFNSFANKAVRHKVGHYRIGGVPAGDDDFGFGVELKDFLGSGLAVYAAQNSQHYRLAVIAIKRGDEVIESPRANEKMRRDDILVMLGKTADYERLQIVRARYFSSNVH